MKKLMDLDLGTLELHWVEQEKFHRRFARQAVEVKDRLNRANSALELTEAEVKGKIRRNPSKWGIDKLTEGQVSEATIRSEAYQAAVTEVNEAKHEVDVLQATLNTLEHRKRALENLVTLHGQSYFAKPHVSAEVERAAKFSVSNAERRAFHKPKKRKG